ncbi:MAG TPA: glycine oxidase ThiO [Pyrinomonadaceae bacterium]|jgi:glycine oxidase|nr:glycine oxidase ThiO [Pyrinomonadaceae bacterium]
MRDQESTEARETADAIIIGGGVIGLIVARSLARRGVKRIVLIERERPGAEASSAAAGMLAAQVEADSADAFLELALASRSLYSTLAAELLEETGIDIELERTGTLYLGFTEEDEREMEARYRWQRSAGLAVEELSVEEARRLEPGLSPHASRALRFPQDAQVENRLLVAALARFAELSGVRLLTGTNVESVLTSAGRVTGVHTSRGTISTPIVIVAAGAWVSFIQTTGDSSSVAATAPPLLRVEPVRGQMLCFETEARPFRHVVYSPRGYLVPRMDGRLLAGSTTERAGFEKRVTGGGIHAITRHALEIAPLVEGLPLLDAWAGLRPRAVGSDEWPVIGGCAETPGLYYATGHYRNGILLAPITGELLALEITTGVRPRLLEPFTPERFQQSVAVSG